MFGNNYPVNPHFLIFVGLQYAYVQDYYFSFNESTILNPGLYSLAEANPDYIKIMLLLKKASIRSWAIRQIAII